MPKEFVVDESFRPHHDGSTLRKKLGIIETPYGKVVAYENWEFCRLGRPIRFVYTVVRGRYDCELPPTETGSRRMNLGPVPKENTKAISKILVREGYREPIEYSYLTP